MVDPKRKASVSVQDSHLENPPKRPRTGGNPPANVPVGMPQFQNPESPLVGPLLESHVWGNIEECGNINIGNIEYGINTGNIEEYGGINTGNIEEHGGINTGNIEEHGSINTGNIEEYGSTNTGNIEEFGSINTGNIEEHGSINTSNIEEHGNVNIEDIFRLDDYHADSQLGDMGLIPVSGEQIFNQEAQQDIHQTRQGEGGFVHEHINPSLLSLNAPFEGQSFDPATVQPIIINPPQQVAQEEQNQPAVDTPTSLFGAPDAIDDAFLNFFNNPSETWQQPPAEEQVGQQNDHGQETLDQQDPNPTSWSPPSITTEQLAEAASDSRPMVQQPPVNPLPPDPTPTGEQISEAPQPIQPSQVNEPVSSNRSSDVQGSQVQPTQRNQTPLSTIQESTEGEDTVEPLEAAETGARRLNSAAPRGRGRGRPRGRPAGRVASTTPRATPVATDENGNPIRAAFACDRCKVSRKPLLSALSIFFGGAQKFDKSFTNVY
jgi:hypothetical protein